ncbi:MAG TPA: aldolase, partial [Candidatus Ruania gallistercoris]|nr:aldolase [Candidatus Ruania gallistercoris]
MTALDSVRDRIEALLAEPDAATAAHYPGDRAGRQPVHSVYVPADTFDADLPARWGAQALEAVERAGGIDHLLRVHALVTDPEEAATIGALVLDKLAREPVEDLRIDFEDGYGDRGDEAEDAAVAAAVAAIAEARAAGTTPPFLGIRFKCLEPETRERGLRTLAGFVTALADRGLPDGLVLTLPKVTTVAQVQAMVLALEALEASLGLPVGRLGFEIQVETPQSVLGPDGHALIGPMIAAGGGRVTGMPYGTYDYSASLGIAAAYQSMEHPAADFAKQVMQVSAAGTGVRLSDGSTNVLPVGEPAAVDAAWALHGRLVMRSLQRGFYQGWDMH